MQFSDIALSKKEFSLLQRASEAVVHIPTGETIEWNRLADLDLIASDFVMHSNSGIRKGILDTARITSFGQSYLAYQKRREKELRLKSIWLPVLVTVITNVAICVLRWLFPPIVQWLANSP